MTFEPDLPVAPLTPAAPTQVNYPGKAVLRTVVAVAVSVIIGLAAVASALQVFLPQFLEAIADALPPEAFAVVSSTIATVILVAGAITRVMAIPGVNEFLTKIKLGATPAPKTGE